MPASFLNVLTTKDISSPEMGRAIGVLILRCTPELFPDRIGNWEPIEAECRTPDDFARHWRWPVLGKKDNPRVRLSVWFRKPHRRYSSISIALHREEAAGVDSTLLAELAGTTNAEFGMIQEVSPDYRPRAEERHLLQFTDKRRKDCFLSLTDESLANGLPEAFDVMWLPDSFWTVDRRKLLTPRPGIFALRTRDSNCRDEVLTAIRKKG